MRGPLKLKPDGDLRDVPDKQLRLVRDFVGYRWVANSEVTANMNVYDVYTSRKERARKSRRVDRKQSWQ